MFRRRKSQNKAKLEHKLCIARETPEPIFDLSDCGLCTVPSGVYSLCKVFLKETLRLDNNCLKSLAEGGELKDLHLLKILDLQKNNFQNLPEDICHLQNLSELYVNNNIIKKLPSAICKLVNLKILNVANNGLKCLPERLGNLKKLNILYINGNERLHNLPKSMCNCQKLKILEMDVENYIYPPSNVILDGVESIIKFMCSDVGVPYKPDSDSDVVDRKCDKDDNHPDEFEAKIRTLESIKKQKLQDFLEIEKANELTQRQELEMAQGQKLNKEKLLADITKHQQELNTELLKIQQERENGKFKLIEQVHEAEQNADVAIKRLLELNREPMAQLLELERQEEERLLAAANKHIDILDKNEILANMQEILQQEAQKFHKFHEHRVEVTKSVLDQQIEADHHLSDILQDQEMQKEELMSKLHVDSDLQKAAVAALLERGDARSWGLIQQVVLVESQLAALTLIEMDKTKLQMQQHVNDLAAKRIDLSVLLTQLLDQQKERRNQLMSTLQTLEACKDTEEDFWLLQYQRLLGKLPGGLSEAQKNMNPALVQALLMNGVINCVPFLAKLTQAQSDLEKITEDDLEEAGVKNQADRRHILDAFQMFHKDRLLNSTFQPSAPLLPVEEASAPLPEEHTLRIRSTECVICFETDCQIIFVPCGHLCCCSKCSAGLRDCPLCRATIERKIKIFSVQ